MPIQIKSIFMKTHPSVLSLVFLVFVSVFVSSFVISKKNSDKGYLIEHEKDIAVSQPGPHQGGGNTMAFSFFSNADSLQLVFRKRILHPGSSIGYHLQERDEIYYIMSGKGVIKINDRSFNVETGDAILTRPGNSHSLAPRGPEDLVVIVMYDQNI
jgi:mannose-6-phosphate isomerase-like protein (cupin superfamily)